MKATSFIRRAAAGGLSALLAFTAPLAAGAEKLADRIGYTDDSRVTDLLFTTDYYTDYVRAHAALAGQGGAAVEIDLAAFTCQGETPALRDVHGRQALDWQEGCRSLTFTAEVPQDGLYQLWVAYYAEGGNSLDITRSLFIDGESPFDEAKNLAFTRYWKDESAPVTNSLGDEVRPAQVEVRRWTDAPVSDNQGMYNAPLLFALTAGRHTLTLAYVDQPMLLAALRLQRPAHLPAYAQYRETLREQGVGEAARDCRFEAESYDRIVYKTNSSIIASSETNATATPRSLYTKRYNYIGGTNWAGGGDAVTWQFDVPKTGLYQLVLRLTQNGNSGMPSTRQIAIDGQVPFQEMSGYVIPYTADWTTHVVAQADGEPYLFYLEEGTHTLTMTAKIGALTDIVHLVTEANSRLSNTYQNIVMVTSQSPDLNYDYELDKAIPGLKKALQEVVDVLDKGIEQLGALTTGTASLENSMRQVRGTVAGYRDRIDRIPSGLADFTASLTSMGDWMTTLKSPTLALDYIRFAPPSEAVGNEQASLWDTIYTMAVGVYQSFVRDYNAVGSLYGDSGAARKTLDVWVSRGKEWAELLKELTDRGFAQERQADVRMNLLPEGALSATVNTLLLAINAGREPDIVLGMPANNAMEYAVRGAVRDLSAFDGFAAAKARSLEQLYIPLTYDGGIYALPETMNFSVLFYRTDVFDKLHMTVPDTWDDVYTSLLPKLYQYNLQMYLPVSYELFLYQHGGQYYSEDRRRTALDSPAGYAAFEQMIANYKDYGFPYSASFYNRFRTGEMPVGIAGLTEYMQISYASPELIGKWDIAPIPATKEGETLNRSTGPALTAVSAMLSTAEDPQLAFDFLDWWSSAATQTEYGKRVESLLGISARWATANTEAFRNLPWTSEHLRVIEQTWPWVHEAPYAVGGYFTARHVTNAVSRCVAGTYSPRESLEEAVRQINIELARKRKDFKLD